VPILIAIPICAYMAGQSLDLYIAQQELRRLANTDPLTGLPNRRSFFHAAEILLAEAAAEKMPCALLVIDADHFKDINDSFGHAVGDRALVAIADALRAKFRQSDLICRVGGEEFAILLRDMEARSAHPMADRVVKSIANSPLVEENAIIEYSVSCGVADTSTTYHLSSLFKHADVAMYTAKDRGRNRVALMEVAA
jgi:diguanylate cyclase (GGDEF)-like protein